MSEQAHQFVLISGRWLKAQHWRLLQNELESRGHQTIAPELPGHEPTTTAKDDALTVVDAIKDYEEKSGEEPRELHPVCSSRGTEVLPYLFQLLPLDRIGGVTLIGSGGLHSVKLRPEASGEPEASRYTPEFESAILYHPDQTEFNHRQIGNLFLNGNADPDLLEFTASCLRPQRNLCLPEDQEPNQAVPAGLPVFFILGTEDRVLNKDRAKQVASRWLGVTAIEKAWGHLPQLTHPAELASELILQADLASTARSSI